MESVVIVLLETLGLLLMAVAVCVQIWPASPAVGLAAAGGVVLLGATLAAHLGKPKNTQGGE